MSFLLDTNVVSEWARPKPDAGVIAWLDEADEDRLFISVATLAELRHGVERLAQGRRRKRLDEWLGDELPLRFEGRILPVDTAVADAWGRLVARSEAAGRAIGVMDALIAATATTHDLTLVTHNVGDFKHAMRALLNPWRDE
ncbi:MAG TPA: type II toxin-antitoxin system VapC family toxin [Stellaceae bacterium]|nr:type II toxin-antitoxin system VapC family toxin [Stellaceae bacterium]